MTSKSGFPIDSPHSPKLSIQLTTYVENLPTVSQQESAEDNSPRQKSTKMFSNSTIVRTLRLRKQLSEFFRFDDSAAAQQHPFWCTILIERVRERPPLVRSRRVPE